MRKLIAVILFLLCLPSMIVCADGTFDSVKSPETGYEFRIEDGAGLFSETDRLFIRNAAEPILKYGNALCVTYKTGSMNNESTARKAARLANARLHGNGVVFLIDMQKRMIYIHSVGAVYKVITKAYGRIITDNVYQYASRRQYGKCASEAFEQISMRLQGYRIAEPLRYIVSGLFALFAGFTLNFIIIAISRRKRKAKRNEGESLQILSATVTCTRKEKVQREGGGFGGGGGGGFSGGGFFGGGFSGGGGGHSF